MSGVSPDSTLQQEERKAACRIADQVGGRERPAQQYGEKAIVGQPDKLHKVKVLTGLDSGGKGENIEWQGAYLGGQEYADEAAYQHRYQHIADIRADESIPDEEGDADLYNQQDAEQRGIKLSEGLGDDGHRLAFAVLMEAIRILRIVPQSCSREFVAVSVIISAFCISSSQYSVS